MDTDVSAVSRTTTGAAGVGPARVRAVYYVSTAVAGKVEIRDGGAGGTLLVDLTTPALLGATHILLPANGVRFFSDPYITLTNVTAVTIFVG